MMGLLAKETPVSRSTMRSRTSCGDFAVEVLHAFAGAGLHGIKQRLTFTFAFFDAFASAGIGFQDFGHGNASAAVGLRQEPLANDVAERFARNARELLCCSSGENELTMRSTVLAHPWY